MSQAKLSLDITLILIKLIALAFGCSVVHFIKREIWHTYSLDGSFHKSHVGIKKRNLKWPPKLPKPPKFDKNLKTIGH